MDTPQSGLKSTKKGNRMMDLKAREPLPWTFGTLTWGRGPPGRRLHERTDFQAWIEVRYCVEKHLVASAVSATTPRWSNILPVQRQTSYRTIGRLLSRLT